MLIDVEYPLDETCDRCGEKILNYHWMGLSFLTYDGRIVCNKCRGVLVKQTFLKALQRRLVVDLKKVTLT